MKSIKHVGRIQNTNTKVVVVFRTLPGESDHALVVPVAALSDDYHDAIMNVVESDQAQDAFEFGEIMFIRPFPDGRPMLQALQVDKVLQKIPTNTIVMTPTPNDTVALDRLNALIAEQKNCAVDDLYTFVSGAPKQGAETPKVEEGRDVGEPNIPKPAATPAPLKASENEVLSDKDIAKSYRSQADAMYKEAAKLRKEADELDPPAKKATKVKESANA